MKSFFEHFGSYIRLSIWSIVSMIVILMHPSIYFIALVQIKAFIRKNWYAHFPYLPIPYVPYLRFRMETLYGNSSALPPTDDLIDYLKWCRNQRRLWL